MLARATQCFQFIVIPPDLIGGRARRIGLREKVSVILDPQAQDAALVCDVHHFRFRREQ